MRVLLATLGLLVATTLALADPIRTQATGLRFSHPSEWTRVPAPSDMRAAQFRVPKAGADTDDGEAVLFFFGKGQGGSAEDNLARWRAQMVGPDGKPQKDAGVVTIKTVNGLKVTSLDLTGAYKAMPSAGGDGPGAPKAGYRLLAAMIEGKGGPWFFRIVGPDATVTAAKPGFQALLDSVEAHE
jgi:hypothetical protein